MIDLALLRNEPDHIIALLHKKEPSYDARRLFDLDAQLRSIRLEVESLRHAKNELAQQAKAGVTDDLRAQSIEVGKKLKEKEKELETTEHEFTALYLACPNIPMADLPMGGKESNKVVKTVGSKPDFSFPIKHHLELGNELGWFDFARASVMTGSNFALYKGDAVRLLYSLALFMFKNNLKHGFTPILPPYLVNAESLQVAGNFPKFKDQVYAVSDDQLYLIPTSEVNLTNMYRDMVIPANELPIRMTSWTSCFRREAGTYGAAERGLIRIHQFEKLELVTLCAAQESMNELERMLACAEDILNQLGLHYRVSLLAAQDCSFQSAKTYDIEVWLPGQNSYYEVSSCSNCTDFQARRGMIRSRKLGATKPELVHTLNASSLAIPRLMAAIMEVYQQEDGTIAIPAVLRQEGLFS